MIFLMFQFMHDPNSYQCENLYRSKKNVISMLILNIKNIPAAYWTIKRQFLKFFKEFLIRISKKNEEAQRVEGQQVAPDDIFQEFKDKILDPKFITKHSDNNIGKF